jgi:Nucleoside recognition/Ferrous iron transport protein B C terminus
VLEESGYLPRAAFLLDRTMVAAGLSGRSFIPLLSSFACAVPGIMATRSIQHPRDRLVTILVAPLMTCSARLPVYALLIGAFVPARSIGGLFNLQGLVLFTLYVAGIASAVVVAWVLKRYKTAAEEHPLLLELPAYRLPNPRDLALGLLERARIFLQRVGGIILILTILLWALASFPAPPAGATQPAIDYSFAGMIGKVLEVVFSPLGFNWQICIALVPALAAREVAVSALATVYALSAATNNAADQLAPLITAQWGFVAAGLVRLRAAMHLHAGRDPPRDQFDAHHVAERRLPVCPGLSGLAPHLSCGEGLCMMYHLFEQGIVLSAVACAAVLAMKKWWPARKRSAATPGGGCGSGCGGCRQGPACDTPDAHGVQRIAMPVRRHRPR